MHPPAMTMTPTIAPAPGLSALPRITALRVIPVAGRDGMLLNLSGAHAPFFTRNLLVLTDSAGRTGVGEVPGGEAIRQYRSDWDDKKGVLRLVPLHDWTSHASDAMRYLAVTGLDPLQGEWHSTLDYSRMDQRCA